ncbi:P-loop NTPase family protein [Leptothrix discophora]|uniref:Uncharacterized protein n=1 Tax=Leptothrix discophora TaxID=89 RepID=A0ABT9G8J7_LEPDI|nr:hypothetical protein [Leptothrix discophora]MDP4302814.1 hypothetical protein [Leptothrix discophora]
MRASLARRLAGEAPQPWLQAWAPVLPPVRMPAGDTGPTAQRGLLGRALRPPRDAWPWRRLDPLWEPVRVEALHATLSSGWALQAARQAAAGVDAQGQGEVLAVLALDDGDDAAQLSAALALACARHDGLTLLVDADLRHPRLHRLFGIGPATGPAGPAGLVNLLDLLDRGDDPPPWTRAAVQAVPGSPDLLLLGAGQPTRRLAQGRDGLLAGPALGRLLQDWRRCHARVLIGCAGAGHGVQGLAVAAAAGQALVIGRSRHSDAAALHALLSRLALLQVRVPGLVIVHR